MNEKEVDIFKIISAAGDSRGAAFEALRFARKGDFEQAEAKMKGVLMPMMSRQS